MSDQGIKRQIDRIYRMNLAELREKFNELFGFEPGQTNIVNLRRRLAYRIQELHFGGLSDNDKEILIRIADGDPMANLQNKAKGMISKLRGTRYQRDWIRNSTVWMLNGRLAKPISPVRKPTDGSASRLVMTTEDIPAAI